MIKALLAGLFALLLGPLAAAGLVLHGWWTYKRHEQAMVERMDQYYLTLTSPGREEYLLEDDETFEVPYMASRLSIAAVPTRIYDAQDRLMGEYSTEKGLYVSDPAELPVFLKRALVATEDGTFYEHRGVNWRAVGRAMLANLKSLQAKQGGSTLTQQLAKLMFTTRKKTLSRKVFELFCARKLESKFTKDQILLMYLNFAYFGQGCFGVESASRYYFGKPARELEISEAAMLVGTIASPNKYSPFENLALAQARHRTVLTRMAKLGYIPLSAVERYSREFWDVMRERLRAPEVSFWRMKLNEAPYAVEFLRRQLLKDFSKERLLKGGLRIRTTFDLEYQRAAQEALQAGLRERNQGLWAGLEASSAPARPPVEGALAAVRPENGAVLALVGGSAFNFQNQLIRAVDSARPMGSAVKPFIFAAAFEAGSLKPEDELEDAPVHYRVGRGKRWSPQNYGNKYYGKVSLAFALRKSLNSVAIRVLDSLDIGQAIGVLSAASGLEPSHFPRNLSLALGTADMTALQMARAYAVFANGGRAVEPYFIRSIEDREGRVIRAEGPRPPLEKAVLSPETCRTMIEVLRGVLGPEGTAHAAALRTGFNIPAAGKTGTTNEYRDAWFAGVTPDLSAAVWVGHDDMRVSLGGGTGGGVAAPVWMEFVKSVHRHRPTRDF